MPTRKKFRGRVKTRRETALHNLKTRLKRGWTTVHSEDGRELTAKDRKRIENEIEILEKRVK